MAPTQNTPRPIAERFRQCTAIADSPISLTAAPCAASVGVISRRTAPPDPTSPALAPRLGARFRVHPRFIYDRSRVASTEAHDDTAVAGSRRAEECLTNRGATIARVPSYNASADHPSRPQTKDKVERFHRPMIDGWAHGNFYSREPERRDALAAGMHRYSFPRSQTACGNQCPWPWQSPHWWPREVPAGGQVEVPTLCSCRP